MQNASAAETSQQLSCDFLDVTEPTLEKTHTRATKTSLTKTLQKWCFS